MADFVKRATVQNSYEQGSVSYKYFQKLKTYQVILSASQQQAAYYTLCYLVSSIS